MGERLTEIFLLLFCEKNSDGTKNLILKGKDMQQRIGTRLIDTDMYKIAHFLKKHPEIVKLNLAYNKIGDKGLEILCEKYLGNRNNLQYLNIISCDLTKYGIERLYMVTNELKLHTLRVNGNKLGREGGRFVSMILNECPSITHIDIGDTDQIVDSVNYVLVRSYHRNLKILDISRVVPLYDKYQYGPEELAENISRFLEMNSTIVELHAQKCEIDGHDVELLLNGLQINSSLKLLDISYNRAGDYGIELLAKWLKTRPNLLGLKVAGNGIKDNGATALSFGMPFSKLRLLDISHNKITDIGLIDILNSVKKPYMLRMFYFWGNQFGHETNVILERMLKSTVFQQEYIDVKLYTVDGVVCAAYYPFDHYKQRYYCVMDYGCRVPIKIKRNRIEPENSDPRALLKFEYVDRFPEFNDKTSGKKTK